MGEQRKQADCKLADKDGWKPLHIATQKGHLAIVRVLVPPDPKKYEDCASYVCGDLSQPCSPLILAIRHGHLDIVKYFVSEFFKPPDKQAASGMGRRFPSFGNTEALQLQRRVDMNKCQDHGTGDKIMHVAVQAGVSLEMVDFLLSKDVNVHELNQEGLEAAQLCMLNESGAGEAHEMEVLLRINKVKLKNWKDGKFSDGTKIDEKNKYALFDQKLHNVQLRKHVEPGRQMQDLNSWQGCVTMCKTAAPTIQSEADPEDNNLMAGNDTFQQLVEVAELGKDYVPGLPIRHSV